ncbi:DUF3320 domain-containing protein [Sporolactobacillus terrae]|uniref:DUF3320 domain-containing protein n=1 Tax=Sporolactobacillus terrae TaxID=269673 RepID=UPI0004911A71|nr:DUF3320 domain-containing protein [Sporolactobacillus terrae]
MADISSYIDKWENQLLDLGKRNRLINYKETKRSNIKIVFPELAGLFTDIVNEEKLLKFPYPISISTQDKADDSEEDQPEEIPDNGDIKTNRSVKDQQKTLASLRRKAKSAIEEQGVNILYLAFGFLKWTESMDSNQELLSPIVLVPVSLKLDSITSPFELGLHEDDIVVNPTLAYKLENDYGIELPNFDEHSSKIIEYLDDVRETIKTNNWEVVEETTLSLLSFLKINMYKDLKVNREQIETHPVIKALADNPEDVQSLPEEYNDYDHDLHTQPADSFQVVDADSSQQDAILFAKKGISFVLQGPPGTGKSQTITNIISESLAAGKKVLFVSEKSAALEVVYKRLAKAEVADFCLKLHSYKANKKEVMQQLGKTLKINKFKVTDEAMYQYEALKQKRDALNDYDEELHTLVPPLNKTIYKVNGEIAKLLDAPEVFFSMADVENTTQDKLNQYKILLHNFLNLLSEKSNDYITNPWKDCQVDCVTHELRHDLEMYLPRLTSKIHQLLGTFEQITNTYNINLPSSISDVTRLTAIMDISSQSPTVPVSWIDKENIELLSQQADQFQVMKEEHQSLIKGLMEDYSNEYLKVDGRQIKKTFEENINNVRAVLRDNIFDQDATIILAKQYRKELDEISEEISVLERIKNTFAEDFSIQIEDNLNSFVPLCPLINTLLSQIHPTEDWFDTNKRAVVKKILAEARDVFIDLNRSTEKIEKDYEPDILKIDAASMLKRFKTDYTSTFKIFKKQYRQDKKIVQSYAKNVSGQLNDASIISVLSEVKNIVDKKAMINENQKKWSQTIGKDYCDDYTNWEKLDQSIDRFETIVHFFDGALFPDKIKQFLLSDNQYNESLLSCKKLFDVLENEEKLPEKISSRLIVSLDPGKQEVEHLKKNILEVSQSLAKVIEIESQLSNLARKPLTIPQLITDIGKLERLQQIESTIEVKRSDLENKYHYLFRGLETDWEHIHQSLSWTHRFKEMLQKNTLPSEFIEKICTDHDTIKKTDKYSHRLKGQFDDLHQEWEWFLGLFKEEVDFNSLDLLSLLERIESCHSGINLLEVWIDYRKSKEACAQAGLSDFIDQIESHPIHKNEIIGAFLKRFYRLWLDSALPKYPAVNAFRERTQEERINEFQKLDELQFKITQKRIRALLADKLPDLNSLTTGFDEVGILKRELNKQRRIMPLRKLFKRIPNLLLTLKPCLMMSPLSVSLFLDAEDYKFDLVVFDEASQVCTENAIGAILRGAQVVIAGDSKQLPPTNFFGSKTEEDFDMDEADDTETDNEAFESVLDQAVSVLPERTLKWHYRSRSEQLIAFSNRNIYNSNLITFPSSSETDIDFGVEYVYVPNGIYDRGGKKNNITEAQKVAELVFDHFTKYPSRTLGVVSFSEAQQQAIEGAINKLRKQKQRFETFFNEDREDAFFIKNLENVQGDERDTIIFSIGYAKDPNGIMYMNFGPLSRDGGYRRLNVAITRAKYNVKLVGSIQPEDISLEKTNSEGVKMLRSYIDYAKNGVDVLQKELHYSNEMNTKSPFEDSVYDYLTKSGYKVQTQVGCSGFRIDLAIESPTKEGHFVLGIECDGATYHSARTARERDRLRQTILEDMGWTIYRIWSTDWIKDEKNEGKILLDAVQAAIVLDESEEDNKLGISSEVKSTDSFDIAPDYVKAIDESVLGDLENPYGFAYYEETALDDLIKFNYLTEMILHVVSIECPVHLELLSKRLLPFFKQQRVTKRVREIVQQSTVQYLSDKIDIRNDFFWIKNETEATARKPASDQEIRSIQYISPEEIANAMLTIIKNSFGIDESNLISITSREFGFNRTGNKIMQIMQEIYNDLLSADKIKSNNYKISLNKT